MEPVVVPTTDVNSEQAELVEWLATDGSPVRKGEVIAEVETSKSVIEVQAPADGFLLHAVEPSREFDLDHPIGHLFSSLDELERQRAQAQADTEQSAASSGGGGATYRASRSAEALAAEHGIDLGTIGKRGLITRADVEALVWAGGEPATPELPEPLVVTDGRTRIALIGSGYGATQVLDILGTDAEQVAVALVDEDTSRWGAEVEGVPVVGGPDRLEQLHRDKAFDAVIVAISTSVAARARFRELCTRHGIPLANAIDPSARIASQVNMGTGNVICAFCHFGVGTSIGDNNFLSAYNSFDHHSTLGSDISSGPGCMTSGLVTIGDRVRFGTGIFVEPKLEIGDDAVVASGSIIVNSVPAGHVVKAKSGASVVSPRRA